ncbi:MAG: STAS domain-containing protein [Pseudomonadota bacterium]
MFGAACAAVLSAAPADATVSVYTRCGQTRVSLTGRVDAAAAFSLETAIAQAAESERVTVDTASVEHIGSAGLRALLRGARLLEAKGKQLVIERASKDLLDLMHLTGMDRVLAVRACVLAA